MNNRLKQMVESIYKPLDRRHQVLRDQLMAAISERRTTRRSPRRRLEMKVLRIASAAGIAALILFAASLLFTNHAVPSASAAEALKEATKASNGYLGWVHVEQLGQGSFLHANTGTNTVAMDTNIGGNREVMFFSQATSEYMRYNAKTITVTMNINSAIETNRMVSVIKKQLMPDTLIEKLDKYGKLAVTQFQEGGLDKFDIVVEGLVDGSKDIPFDKLVVLVNPDTSLIQEVKAFRGEGVIATMKFTYGEPEIKDIYDLGVPRDATVIDAGTSQPN